jgi:Flp pilus assembly protein TadB
MKKCPYCGMSNGSMNTICLNCWERLEHVSEDASPGVRFPDVIADGPLLNAAHRAGDNVLRSKHDPTFTASSIMLAGIFLFLVLVSLGHLEVAFIVLVGTVLVAGLFRLSRRSNRAL